MFHDFFTDIPLVTSMAIYISVLAFHLSPGCCIELRIWACFTIYYFPVFQPAVLIMFCSNDSNVSPVSDISLAVVMTQWGHVCFEHAQRNDQVSLELKA